jgi:RHS repeat-associated protein
MHGLDRFGNRWQQNGPNSFLATFTGNNPGNPQNNNRMDGYSYDAAGNVLNDGTHGYTYDAENRIISVDNGATATYVYDSDGHRVQKTSTTGNPSDPAGTWIYFYDQSGRWVQKFTSPGNTFVEGNIYAGGRHLASVGGGTNFSHSDWLGTERVRNTFSNPTVLETCSSLPFGDGRRVAKVGSKLYWYGSGNATAEYILFGGNRIAQLPATGNPIYYVEDLLGTSRVITTAAGVVCYDADFYPYGGERPYTNTCPQNYKFEGKERDTETGNDDFGARYYSNRFGRWLSADWSSVPAPVPYANLTNPQTLNLYSMVADDPESFADLDGHEECFANGACNSLRNPASAEHWIVNGISNTVSDLLSLDEVAKGSVDMANAETTEGKIGTGLGLALLVGLNVFTGGEEGAAAKGAEIGAEDASKALGGRLGSAETRALDKSVAEGLKKEGAEVTGGAGRAQEYIKGPGPGTKGSAYPDVTAVKDGKPIRVNTVDTLKDGRTPTAREQRNTNKIAKLRPNEELRIVPKPKKPTTPPSP